MVRLTDRPAMTVAVDLGRKATMQTGGFNSVFGNLNQYKIVVPYTK